MKQLCVLLVTVFAACDVPVFAGADKHQSGPTTGRIEGEVVVASASRGKVVLFLYDAARPPPPTGTGHPLTFTVVSREAVFGDAAEGAVGPFTAPFAFSLVAPGQYLIRGFVDANDDFIPWYGVTADVNAGDVGGAAVDPVTHEPRVTEIDVDGNGAPVPALKVPVSFSDSAKVPVDRPVFEMAGDAGVAEVSAPATVIELQSRPIDEGAIHQAAPAFLLRFVDDDGDGAPDDANGDGVPDLWPRVVVRKLAAGKGPLVDENDLDGDGVVDAEGVDYLHADGTQDGKPDVVVLAAGFDPTEYAAQLFDSMGKVKQTPTPVTHLKLVIRPAAFDASDPRAPAMLSTMPAGDYAITVIQQTGQTWRVPNELAPGLGDAIDLPVVSTQGFVVRVP